MTSASLLEEVTFLSDKVRLLSTYPYHFIETETSVKVSVHLPPRPGRRSVRRAVAGALAGPLLAGSPSSARRGERGGCCAAGAHTDLLVRFHSGGWTGVDGGTRITWTLPGHRSFEEAWPSRRQCRTWRSYGPPARGTRRCLVTPTLLRQSSLG